MISQEKRLYCRLDGLTTEAREQQRLKAMTALGLLQTESIPIFEEATQTAAQTLEMPICYLGLMEPDRERFKSAIGLSRLGLMNQLASLRQLPRMESFCTHVVDSQHLLMIEDTLAHPAFANQLLVHQYGIRSFLGAPLMTSAGWCVGALAVMDTVPRVFTQKDAEFLSLMARWSMSEYERSQASPIPCPGTADPTPAPMSSESISSQLRVDLLSHLAQELRTPLTSVMGMASVLTREIYGPLTSKQKEYLNIIHNSGQYLLSLMSEIVELSEFKQANQSLNLTSVDIEMLCQQAINTLEHAAQRREQKIRLTVEPNRRIWTVDKEKVRQMLYHLIFSVIQSSTAGSVIRLHISRRESNLNLAIWVSHPWLGEGLPYLDIGTDLPLVTSKSNGKHSYDYEIEEGFSLPMEQPENYAPKPLNRLSETTQTVIRQNLGLMLCQQLAELHQGHITIQGSDETDARYIISLPRLTETTEN